MEGEGEVLERCIVRKVSMDDIAMRFAGDVILERVAWWLSFCGWRSCCIASRC